MYESSLWSTNQQFYSTSYNSTNDCTRKLSDRLKWARNSFSIPKQGNKKDQSSNIKLMQYLRSKMTKDLVHSHKDTMKDLEELTKVKNAFLDQQIINRKKNGDLQQILNNMLQQNISRNSNIQKKQQQYSHSHKATIQKQCNLNKSISSNIQQIHISTSESIGSQKMISAFNYQHTTYKSKNYNHIKSVYSNLRSRASTNYENPQKVSNDQKIDKNDSSSIFQTESIFRSRKLKYCHPSTQTVRTKQINLQMIQQPILKFIQKTIQKKYFCGEPLMNKSVYKRKTKTLYK